MDFQPSERCMDFSERLTAFMDEHVHPAEGIHDSLDYLLSGPIFQKINDEGLGYAVCQGACILQASAVAVDGEY